MEKEKLLTVVIPIYNVERYLNQCLDSLLHQTISDNHCVIMVNDGSTDASGDIAKSYAERYPDMFQYFEQENAGPGAAQNVGLREVQTEYVCLLDSDDWLVPRFMEHVIKRLKSEKEKPDMMYTLPYIYDMATCCFGEWMDKPLFDELFNSTNPVVSAKQDPRIYALEPSAKRIIYRTEFLRKQQFSFPEGTKWEDVEPHFRLLHAANRCIGEGSVGFCYRINSGNQITSSSGWDRLQVVSVFSRALSYGLSQGWEDIEITYIVRMMIIFSKWSISFSSLEVRKELVKRLHQLYRVLPKKVFSNYYKWLNPPKKDKLYIKAICSPFYKIIGIPAYCNKFYILAKRVVRKIKN